MDAAVEAEALLVMATIESDVTWNLVDYESPIKIGVVQWVGSEAAALLDGLDPADKSQLEQSLVDDLTTYGTGDFWDTRYLSKDEGNSIIDALGTSSAETSQRSYFSTMITRYESTMSKWGYKTSGTVQQQRAFVFVACVYHLSIAEAGRITTAIGASASTDAIYAAIMNGNMATWRDWWHVKDMLDQWEGVEPIVTGGTEQPYYEPGGGQETIPIQQVESQVQKIGYTGQELIVYGEDNPDGVICYRATNNMWYPSSNTAAPPTPTPVDPPAPPEPEPPATQTEWEQMRQLWYDNEEAWYYSQANPGRMDPPSSGYSDCSASIIWAVSQIRPDLGKQLGVWTGSMANAGIEIARGNTGAGAHVDLDTLQPGDILLVGNNYTFDNYKSHVEWYFGDGMLWGSGFSPLPHRTGDINNYLVMIASRGKTVYMIRRFL